MAITEAHRAALEKAYLSGAVRVSYDGKSVEYRSLDEMKRLLDEANASLSGIRRRRRFYATTRGDKGL